MNDKWKELLPPIFEATCGVGLTSLRLGMPWIEGECVYASDGRRCVRMPCSSQTIIDELAVLHDGKKPPQAIVLFDNHWPCDPHWHMIDQECVPAEPVAERNLVVWIADAVGLDESCVRWIIKNGGIVHVPLNKRPVSIKFPGGVDGIVTQRSTFASPGDFNNLSKYDLDARAMVHAVQAAEVGR